MRIGNLNLNYAWSPERQRRAVRWARRQGRLDVLATQEDVTGDHRERVRVVGKKTDELASRVLRRGWYRANHTRLGYRIRRRNFGWALVADWDLPEPVYVISAHLPPRRMPLLYPLFGRRLRAFLADLEHPWIVAGDWNRAKDADPAALKRTFRARFYGQGIELFAVHPDLAHLVRGVESIARPGEHPLRTLVLGEA